MLKINYKLTGKGWAKCEVQADNKIVNISASYISDALGMLVQAVLLVLADTKVIKTSFVEEPGEYRWIFTPTDNGVQVQILEFDDVWTHDPDSLGKEIFIYQSTKEELKKAMVDCLDQILKDMTLEEYNKKWGLHEFPSDLHNQLKK
ncbi:MAG: hypothetical protein RJB39_658 [Candidatus Parcubacteria bacterium]|jgi:hypothetical protein